MVVQTDCEKQLQEHGRCILMVDAVLTRMHTTEFREQMTNWFDAHESAEVHVLTESSMVRMAVNVSTLSGGRLRALAYDDEAAWLGVGRHHYPGFRRRHLALPHKPPGKARR